jgi:tRNA pseudouridine38-40 synthase
MTRATASSAPWAAPGAAHVTHRLDIEYDGGGFYGWAMQPGLATVEGSLVAALRTVLGREPRLTVAGRTDAGVHARRQVVSVSLPPGLDLARVRGSLNALTPPGLVVRHVTPAPGFDARRHAVARSYRYFVDLGEVRSPFWASYRWCPGYPLDVEAMAAAAAMAVGRHDWRAFTPTETEHLVFERTVTRCQWRVRGDVAWLEIEAESFLRHMVRSLVGMFVEVGRGRRDLDDVRRLLAGALREEAGPTAPAHGLFLWRIRYPHAP